MATKKRKKVLIAPSILSADFARLGKDIESVERGGCDWIHVDVMDGHFVPNLTIGPVVVKGIRPVTALPLDVHLMIENPERYIADFAKAGADYITVHYEVCKNAAKVCKDLKKLGVKTGMSIKPGTKLTSKVLSALKQFDMVLVMTVEPGFGGQSFMSDMVPKIQKLRENYKGIIAVDGGINDETITVVKDAGVDVVVAGSYIFSKKNRKKVIQSLKDA